MPAPQLDHIATFTATLTDQHFIPDGPLGTRVVAEVGEVSVVGERLNASLVGVAAADWLTVAPDRSFGTLDVRLTLKTDDDVLIYCTYGGRIDLAAGRAIAAPLFQTGDERYDWLARNQFIMDGIRDETGRVLTYQLYQVVPQ